MASIYSHAPPLKCPNAPFPNLVGVCFLRTKCPLGVAIITFNPKSDGGTYWRAVGPEKLPTHLIGGRCLARMEVHKNCLNVRPFAWELHPAILVCIVILEIVGYIKRECISDSLGIVKPVNWGGNWLVTGQLSAHVALFMWQKLERHIYPYLEITMIFCINDEEENIVGQILQAPYLISAGGSQGGGLTSTSPVLVLH